MGVGDHRPPTLLPQSASARRTYWTYIATRPKERDDTHPDRRRDAVGAALALALPAVAATPTYKGTVGPGFTIKMASKPTKAGNDQAGRLRQVVDHNFHLVGPGVNVKTSVRPRHEDVHRHAQEGHLQVHVRPARELMKGSFKVG